MSSHKCISSRSRQVCLWANHWKLWIGFMCLCYKWYGWPIFKGSLLEDSKCQ
jgi:hypothetical protein